MNSEFKFNKYQVEKGNQKIVSKTYHSSKNMHTALFLLYFVNQQLQNLSFNFKWVIYWKLQGHLHHDI